MPETVKAVVLDAYRTATVGGGTPLSIIHVIVLTEPLPDMREKAEFVARVSDETYREVRETLDSLDYDDDIRGIRVMAELDPADMLPAYDVNPCPLCGEPDQLVKSNVQVVLSARSCDGCGEVISTSNLPPEFQSVIDTTLDAYEQATGHSFFGDPPPIEEPPNGV